MPLPLNILTLVLDGMPFLPMQLATFNRLRCDWRWNVVHGAAHNSGSTSWCKPQQPRLSTDGSTEFLNSLRNHPRIRLFQKQFWAGGKDEMVNMPLLGIKEPCVLLEVDVDELWTPEQIEKLVQVFSSNSHCPLWSAQFYCRYFIGCNIVTVGSDCYGNQARGEWDRAWRFQPGMKWISHEPPILDEGNLIPPVLRLGRDETRKMGLVFDHYSWVFPHQVAFKEVFYGYKNALAHWTRLQHNQHWPVRLKDFLPWVDDRAMADLLHK